MCFDPLSPWATTSTFRSVFTSLSPFSHPFLLSVAAEHTSVPLSHSPCPSPFAHPYFCHFCSIFLPVQRVPTLLVMKPIIVTEIVSMATEVLIITDTPTARGGEELTHANMHTHVRSCARMHMHVRSCARMHTLRGRLKNQESHTYHLHSQQHALSTTFPSIQPLIHPSLHSSINSSIPLSIH